MLYPGMVEMDLGPFERLEQMATGEWSEVWRGRHVPSDLDVAIKFVTATKARDPTYRRRFRQEVRAVARLRHPGIVEVLDYGEITEGAPEGTGPVSPYLVTEWAEEGTTAEFAEEMSWPELRDLLFELTGALGHAHARDIVHRDIKPQNVLMTRDEEGRRRPKLTDFGLAHIPDRAGIDDEFVEGTCGTLEFMAPEQFEGDWLEYGPWTDLYALGCTAWWLAAGSPVYSGRNAMEMAHKHMNAPLPEFEPACAVPDGFRGWLARCLEIDSADRFRTAASARCGLLELGGEEASGSHGGSRASLPEFRGAWRMDFDACVRRPEGPERTDGQPRWKQSDEVEPAERKLPRPPEQSSYDAYPKLPMQLVGAGRELFQLRELSLVGRESERDELWSRLRDVEANESTELVMLTGGAGVGKSRLARWVREWAHQVAGLAGMHVEHGERATRGSPLASMIERHLDLADADYADVLDRLESWYRARGVERPYEWRAMANVLGAVPPTGQPDVKVTEPAAERALVRRFLARVAESRPLVVEFDDLQWGLETVEFLESALGSDELADQPVLFVGTYRNDAFVDREVETNRVERLFDHASVRDVEVGPLGETAQRFLVEQLLYLAPSAAREVLQRSGGNPGFAVTLVDDWLERDLLETGEHGFELAVESPELPDDLREVWARRVERLADRLDSTNFEGLVVAALLGEPFGTPEWRGACEAADVSADADLLEQLVRDGIVVATESGFRLAHQLLREAIELRARREEQWARINAARAEQLAARDPEEAPTLERLAEHWRAAGEDERAVDPLLEAVDLRGSAGELDAAEWALERAESILDELDRSPQHPDEIVRRLRRGRIALALYGDVESGEEYFREAQEAAASGDHRQLEIRASLGLGRVLERTGRRERAGSHFRRARDQVDLANEPALAGRVHRNLGRFLTFVGDPGRASDVLEQPLESSELPERIRGKLLARLVSSHRLAGRLDRAQAALEEGLEVLERSGFRALKPVLLSSGCEVAIDRGEFERAEGLLEQIERLVAIDDLDAHRGMIGLLRIVLAFARDDTAAAEYQLQQLPDRLPPVPMGMEIALRLRFAAVRERWEDVREVAGEWESYTGRVGLLTDPDAAVHLEAAAVEARRRGADGELVQRLEGLAEHQWEKIEEEARRRRRTVTTLLPE